MARTAHGTIPDGATRFRHEALFYDGDDDFVAATSAFLLDGIAQGEPALVVVSAAKIERLREELGAAAAGVHFADMAAVGQNPARIIPAWFDFVTEHAAPGVRLRGIGEPIFSSRSADELVECQRHESLLNLAFADADDFWLVCPYDTSSLPSDVLEEAWRSHPYAGAWGDAQVSAGYEGLAAIAAPFAKPLPEPPEDAVALDVGVESLAAMRCVVDEQAARFGVDRDRRFDLVLAANEIATNSLEHGAGSVRLLLWRTPGSVVCEIRDEGSFDDPLAGRRVPAIAGQRGRGLWIANRLCDLVQIRSSGRGTSVRIHLAA
jgi:anti-sigma regulatory factor (Ser/Thr protein kinase)